MRKLFLVTAILTSYYCSFSQQPKSDKFQNASKILNTRVTQLANSGYDIKAVMIRDDWGGITLSKYDLISYGTDSIFLESYVFASNFSYMSDPTNGLTAKKLFDENGVQKSAQIQITKTKFAEEYTKLANTYFFKSFYIPTKSDRSEYGTSYIFDMTLLNEIMGDEPISTKSTNHVDRSKVVLLIIYSKYKM